MFKLDKKHWFVILFLLSFVLRFMLLDYSIVRIIEADGVGYISGAKGFLNGFDIRNIGIIDHPVFGILIAFFSYITPDWETAGRMVSITSGSLIGPLIFLISIARANSLKVSIFSGLFIAGSPLFVPLSFQVFNDTLNCTILVIGVWQLIVASTSGKSRNFFYSGLGFALAYLTRPDSIVPSFFAFLVAIYYAWRSDTKKKGLAGFSAFAIGFMILAVPYIFYMHSQIGKWVVTGRQVAAQTNLPAIAGGGNYEDENYGLTPDLTLKGDLSLRVASGGTDIKKGVLSLWFEKPDLMFSNMGNNLKIEWDVFTTAVPWYIKILALVSIVASWRGFISNNLALFAFSSPLLFLYPFFWADTRHIYHFLLPLWLWAAEGVESLFAVMKKIRVSERYSNIFSRIGIMEYFVYAAIIISFISSFTPVEVGPKELNYLRQKEMGVWISKNTHEGAVVMARWGRLTFYTDRKTVMFPYADWEMIKKYIKKNGVTHLVVDESFFDMRPQIQHILTPILSGSSVSPDDSLSIVRIKRDRFGGMIVYEVKK